MDEFNRAAFKSILLFTFLLALATSTYATSHNPNSCGEQFTEILEFEEILQIDEFTQEYEFNDSKGVLAQSKCSDLKPDYCGMGGCKDGWVCKANVNSCMCFPPN